MQKKNKYKNNIVPIKKELVKYATVLMIMTKTVY